MGFVGVTEKYGCDILNLEWASSGRDIDIVEPVLTYLEWKYGLKIIRECISNYELKLLRHRPKMLVIANGAGGELNFHAIKLASRLGIKVVTLISEGDYIESDSQKGVEGFFWGWNKDRIMYQNLHLEWTDRNVELIYKHIPNAESFNIKVSGATGFDRYKVCKFMDKKFFLNKYSKADYKKVIGIAAWGFDLIFSDYYDRHTSAMEARFGENHIDMHKKSRDMLKEIYKKLIINNQDALFVLKHHPGVYQEVHTEFEGLDQYSNVIVMRREENIGDLINVSDLWIAYDSTTCLEAWLLNTPTILINPVSDKFLRSTIAEGSPILKTYEETQEVLTEFYKNNSMRIFEDRESYRARFIRRTIQHSDGENHIRAGEHIYIEFTRKTKIKRKIRFWEMKRIGIGILKNVIYRSPLKKLGCLKEKVADLEYFSAIYKHEQREEMKNYYKENLIKFYGQKDGGGKRDAVK